MNSEVAGRYRLEQRLSTTEMAEVWVATDVVLERRVVVKLLAPEADRRRFEREAQAAAGLAHTNIVQLFDYGEYEDRPFIVLEYLDGGTLAERLPEGEALPDEQTRRYVTDIAAGLAHAHRNGVIHRDLKPGNVLFDAEGRAKVGDFGIARVLGTDTLTEDGTVLGTAAFISPEQVSGNEVTPAADVYSFGVLLYRLLTGRLPFESKHALEIARMHRDSEPPPLRSLRSGVPSDLATLAAAALAKEPAGRPADGVALLEALEPSRPATAAAEPATTRLPVTRRRRGRLVYSLAAILLAAAGIFVAVLVAGAHSSAPAIKTNTRAHPSPSRHPTTTARSGPVTTTASTSQPTTRSTTPRAPTTTPAATPTTSPTTLPTSASTTTVPPTTTITTTATSS